MKRKSPTADDLGIIARSTEKKVVVAMPKGGFKNTREVTRKVTLAGVAVRSEEEVTPRMLRRR
jgi:hypothetical protein